ncbi:MAG: DNA mismatch endonuclease Vsr [Roseiarcus sp.]
MDTLTPVERSERMSRVRAKDTSPELAVRSTIHRLGYRYRLHARTLPGHPDLVFAMRRKVVFVHGCFWHRHENCKLARLPKSRLDFWIPKLEANRERDLRNQAALKTAGWDCLVVWECELGDRPALERKLKSYLGHR